MTSELPPRRILPDDWLRPLVLGHWYPHPERPLEVDVGSGKGRFLLARAARFPGVNFLGIERLLGRLRKIDRKACRGGLANVRLLRMDAYYATTYLLPAASVSTFYVFFPDPWPKVRHQAHRLFNEAFLEALARTLRPGGRVHVATDHLPYFEQVRAILAGDGRFEPAAPFEPAEEERTDFELLYLHEKPIGRCSFARAGVPAGPARRQKTLCGGGRGCLQ